MQNIQMNQIDIIISKIDALIWAQNDNVNLWNAERCAQFFSCSSGHFKTRIATKKGFPAPVKLNQSARSLWFPADVKAYAQRKKTT